MLLLATLLAASSASADDAKRAGDELLAVETARMRMTVSADFAGLDQMLADDLTYCHANGSCETKAQYMANLRSGATRYSNMELVTSRVRRHGDIAILNGQVRFDGEMGGKVINNRRLVYTDVYRHEAGHWRLIAWHSSLLPRVGHCTRIGRRCMVPALVLGL
ncbi:MAG: nuclear transport factor 2 family protein [Proteobacteria bacterium]|nr:nuclear transport factor 2 family protein [Pseudomonadota bacterium]